MKTIIESSGQMHRPAHPGEILKEMYMTPLGVTVTKVVVVGQGMEESEEKAKEEKW